MSEVQLHLGDCLEVLAMLESESVDIVITDPPYINSKGGYVRGARFGGVGEVINANVAVGPIWGKSLQWAAMAWRVTRYGVMAFCSFKEVAEMRIAFPDAQAMGLLTWYLRNAPPFGKNVPNYDVQFVWLLKKQPGIKWDDFGTMLIDIPFPQAGCFASERILKPGTRKAAHPCQKPLELMKRLLVGGCRSVLDPFMGTGTTGVACVQTGRNFIGIEIEQKYFDIAQERIGEALEKSKQPHQLGMEV